jgi:RNA 3'-terminal phosphate cyclase (ATP)
VPVATDVTDAETACPGSAVTLVAVYDGSRAGFSALGEAGVPAEDVASEAVAGFERFHGSRAAVARHLADQLQVPLSLRGGRVTAPAVPDHVATNRQVVAAFGYEAAAERCDGRVVVAG